MTPAIRLAGALRRATPDQKAALASRGIDGRIKLRAARAQPVNACDYLRISSLIGIDPVTGLPVGTISDVDSLHYPSLSAALRMKRIQDNLNLRTAAKRAKLSYSALGRIERGEPVSIDNLLAACKWLGRHPFDFVSPYVSRESTETRSVA